MTTNENQTMNTETEKNINELMEWVGSTADQTKGFILEQAPLYAQEVVAWSFWCGVFIAVVGLILTIAATAFAVWGLRRKFGYMSEMPFVIFVVCLIGFAVGVPMMVGGTLEAVKAKVSPRVLIVEHVRG